VVGTVPDFTYRGIEDFLRDELLAAE